MQIYENKELRREILKTLKLAQFSSFRVKALLNALRPTGFVDLSTNTLGIQILYLQKKGFVEIEKTKNVLTDEEFDLVSITPKGIDLLEGNCSDVGVACG